MSIRWPQARLPLLRRLFCFVPICFLVAVAGCERADKALDGHRTINIWSGVAPGSEDWDIEEQAGFNSITNVTTPTITVFEPDPKLATGNAMIVCPGGRFSGLSIVKEGVMVAEWLAARGVTAFVLKYRVRRDLEPSSQSESADFDERAKPLEAGRKIAAADGIQAMRVVRSLALDFKIDPNRIGMMGFSAGAMTTMSVVAKESRDVMPNIAASIYGAMPGEKAPTGAPPLFLAHADDDSIVPVGKSLAMESAWQKAGIPVELSVYKDGGHGFGAVKQGKASDAWMDDFEKWLIRQGWINAPI